MRSSRAKSADAAPATAPRALSLSEQRQALMEYALRALAQRSLSQSELRAKLLRRLQATGSDNAPTELCEEVIERLVELRYLDDAQVAYAENQRRGVGTYRVRARMQRRGLESELIEQALQARSSEAELEEASALLDRRLAHFLRGKNPKARAYGYLARRGYGSGVISRALEGVNWSAEDEGDEDVFPDEGLE